MEERRDPLGNLAASIDARQNLVSRLGILGVSLDALAGDAPDSACRRRHHCVDRRRRHRFPRRRIVPGDIVYAVNTTSVASLDELRATSMP